MKPGRYFNLILLAAMMVGAIMTYQTKIRTEKAAERVTGLQAEIDRERGEIALLKAELSMLEQPGRLQSVVEQYPETFRLVPFAPDQIAAIEDIPMRQTDDAEAARDTLARLSGGAGAAPGSAGQ